MRRQRLLAPQPALRPCPLRACRQALPQAVGSWRVVVACPRAVEGNSLLLGTVRWVVALQVAGPRPARRWLAAVLLLPVLALEGV